MSKTTVNLFQTIKEAIPTFIRTEFPLFGELLEQYYIGLEKKTGVYDILNQIDRHIKLDEILSVSKNTKLVVDNFDFETTIQVESTEGFPERNGLIKIDDEIIFYREKDEVTFIDCYRGFSGVDSFGKSINFSKTFSQDHNAGSLVSNLYSDLLQEFLSQIKKQILPGLESSDLVTNENVFLKQSVDLYSSKGSKESFRILFYALFGVSAEIIRPQENLIEPSKSYYNITTDLLVEPIVGDVERCLNRTIFQQSESGELFYGTVTTIEKVNNLGREYYIISVDFNYDKDIINKGSLFGVFTYSQRTVVLEDVTLEPFISDNSIFVNSTLGFPNEGTLQAKTPNGELYDVNYFSKNSNQFFVNPSEEILIPKNSYLTTKNFAFCEIGDEKIEVRICPIFSNDFEVDKNSLSLQKNDPIVVSSLGENNLSAQFNNWVFNLRNGADVLSISIEDSSLNKYKIEFFNEYDNFYPQDKFDLISSDGIFYELTLLNKSSNKVYTFSSNKRIVNINSPGFQSIRKISKSNFSEEFSPTLKSIANVQNVYTDQLKKDVYVETGSIPSYGKDDINLFSKRILFSGNYSGDVETSTLKIGKNKLLTGEAIVYSEPFVVDLFDENGFFIGNGDNPNRLSILNGKYFVKVVDSENIKLAVSLSKLFNNQFVSFSGSVTNNSLYYANRDWLPDDFISDYIISPDFLRIEHQKLIKKVSIPTNTETKVETKPGSIGIFKNGTELLNYKSLDSIFYGAIKKIDVLIEGQEYDIINRPKFNIDDTSLGITYGSGAVGEARLSGSLKRIDVLNPGVGFLNKPSIKISGGNGSGAVVSPIFESNTYSVDFNSSNSVSLSTNEIIFGDDSYFVTGEVVRYVSGVNTPLGGLTNNSSYFVRQSSSNRVKLYKNIDDCKRSVNELNISAFGTGVHSLIAVKNRNLLVDFKVINEGSGYKSTNLIFNSSSINIYDDSININNHQLKTGEIIVYKSTDISLGGLSSGQKYYVYKVSESKIKLSLTEQDLNLRNFINITSTGEGLHTIEYDPIEVTITNLDDNNNNTLNIRPIFRGFVDGINLIEGGSGYGSSEIINFNRQPTISLETGSGCKLKPIILQGRIFSVVIENQGSGYNSVPDLEIIGDGTGAKILPILNDGRIIDVVIQSPGSGYSKDTTIFVKSSGSGADFFADIEQWTINLVEKNFLRRLVTDDDGFLSKGKFGLKYTYCYTPRKLREFTLTKRFESGVERFIPDLTVNSVDGKEQDSRYHSPILGWAYDGNPIYGPYGFSNPDGTGQIVRLKSGYNISPKDNRPGNELIFPLGFFVEDYQYSDGNDLDESNGRFCVTPEYPKGTYAYFTTIGDIDPLYKNYRKPVFPYVIGNTYKSKPIDFNFDVNIDQDSAEVYSNLLKNTTPYNLFEENSNYEGIDIVDLIENHTSEIRTFSKGSVDFVSIISNGDNYKVDDRLVFDNTNTNSFGLKGSVKSIKGREIVSIDQTITNIEGVDIYRYRYGSVAICSSPHNINDFGNYIYFFDGEEVESEFYPDKFVLVLTENLENSSITGLTTYINISGNTNSVPFVFENDIFKLDDEELKILEVDKKSSRLRVLRSQNGTVGSYHTAGAFLEERSRKLYSNSESSSVPSSRQRQIYFNPVESFGIGTERSTLNIINPSFYPSSVSVDPGKIYLRDHFLGTNDIVTYNSNSNFPIRVEKNSVVFSLEENQQLYVYRYSNDFIGLYDEPIYLNESGEFVDSTRSIIDLFKFVDYGNGDYHSFKVGTNTNTTLNQYNLQVTTDTNHSLNTGDFIDFDLSFKDTKNIKLVYDIENRLVCANPVLFSGSDIDLENNTIFIENHGLKDFQKVIYTSSSPSLNLTNEEIYYINVVDNNKISLLDRDKNFVNIGSESFGNILPINPDISVEKNKSIVFDLSDETLSFVKNDVRYSGFKLKIYTDENRLNELNSTGLSNSFNVIRIGEVGINLDAKLILTYDKDVPSTLYYRLEPIKNDVVPNFIRESFIDEETSKGRIDQSISKYEKSYQIIKTSDKSFKFSLDFIPQDEFPSQYDSNYTTNSKNALGPVNDIEFTSKGKDFTKIPYIKSIESENGSDFFGILYSSNIGNLQNLDINNIKYELLSDPTLIPKGLCPISIKVEPLASIEKIEILNFGTNYTKFPDLILIDGFTKKKVSDIAIKYNDQTSKVDVLKNTNGIYNVTPRLVPVNNTNGYKILSLNYDDFTRNATIVFDTVGFSTITDFPFEIGSKFLIENLITTDPESDLGYNSENYDYRLYTVIESDPNIGGQVPSITFSMSDFTGSVNPGFIDPVFTSGRIIPESFFPQFNVVLKKNIFFENELLISNNFRGNVLSWDKDNEFLKVKTKVPQFIEVGELIFGNSSSSFGTISDVVGVSTVNYNLSSLRSVEKGWSDKKGFLNEDSQRLHDSDYYQYFSYAVKSTVDNAKWDALVQETTHTAGFKRFSNLSVESDLPDNEYEIIPIDSDGGVIGIANIDSESDLNCFYDHDLAFENNINVNPNKIISDEIIFNSKLLQDYFESSGNRALIIDDISGEFNSNARSTRFAAVNEFPIGDFKYRKYFINSSNKFFPDDSQSIIVNLIQDGVNGYLNQYARVETIQNQGYFDFTTFDNNGFLLFFPQEFEFNDYDITGISLNIGNDLIGSGSTSFGNVAKIEAFDTIISSGSTAGVPIKILTQSGDYRTAKYIITVETEDTGFIQSNEFNIVNGGSDVFYTEFGILETSSFSSSVSSGFATYYPEINGSVVDIYLVPNSNTSEEYKVNIVATYLSDDNFSDVSSVDLKTTRLLSSYEEILGSPSTSPQTVITIENEFNSFYALVSIEDTTEGIYECRELVIVPTSTELYITDFANLVSDNLDNLGTFSGVIDDLNNQILIQFEPYAPNKNVQVRAFVYALKKIDLFTPVDSIDLDQSNIAVIFGEYIGTENAIKREFEIKYKGLPVFERLFDADDSSVVLLEDNSIVIPNHFFNTGEKILYSHPSLSFAFPPDSIGIKTTIIAGVSTDKLPTEVYAIKVNDTKIRLATSAENALKFNPEFLELTTLGIGSDHKLTATRPNVKGIFTIDNVIQSPIIETDIKVELNSDVSATDIRLKLSGISSISSSDILKINDEIVFVETVGASPSDLIRVRRRWLGTELQAHGIGSTVTKLLGNYNIVNNTLNFVKAPFGKVPLSAPQNELGAPFVRPDDRDFTGITTNSSFSGRVFLRTGEVNSVEEVYEENYLFDDISRDFTGITSEFVLKTNDTDVVGISSNNAIILIKDIFQQPGRSGAALPIIGNYGLIEQSGQTILQFNPSTQEVNDDINVTGLPVGGKIISLGSTSGFGYQPLVAAGGTAVISGFGSISQIIIGNSGSGYRSGIQTIVNAYSQTSSSVEVVGFASIVDGNVSSVTITNPGTSYTNTNAPLIFFDSPLGYSNLPLIYSDQSVQGVGTGAKVDLVVGRDSSIFEFEVKNSGYNYREGEILTVDISELVGIPTDQSKPFREFQISVNSVKNDEYSGWSIGDVQQLDPIDDLFNGIRTVFPLRFEGNRVSIIAKRGSNIDVEATLLIFINGILQVPGRSYTFKGGSRIVFTEPPKKDYFSNILFYRGTKDIDVRFVDTIEPIEPGDTCKISSNLPQLNQDERQIEQIISADIVGTTPYSGPGVTDDDTLLRPIDICRQTEDLYLNGSLIPKTRSSYDPFINPSTNIIQNVDKNSTEIFVESVKTFFDSNAENISTKDRSEIQLISQENILIGVATAIVSSAGSITSIDIVNPGYGYTVAPEISISNPPESSIEGIPAEISLTILEGKINTVIVDNPGRGYDENNPPYIIIESPKVDSENIISVQYEGDFGIIAGIANTIVGIGSTALQMDLYIDNQSFLKNSNINLDISEDGTSGISTNYFFAVTNSNIGLGVTSLYCDGTTLSSTNLYFDNIFQVYDFEINEKEIIGAGVTSVVTITTLISSQFDLTLPLFDSSLSTFDNTNFKFDSNSTQFSYFGNYSWGRISFDPERSRKNKKQFNSYYQNGYAGISTSTVLKRVARLKSRS